MAFYLLISTFIGCNSRISEEDFIVEYSQELCARIFSCISTEDQVTIEEFYGSQEECASKIQADIEASLNSQELEYNPQKGKDCVAYLQEVDCNDTSLDDEICNNVYSQKQ